MLSSGNIAVVRFEKFFLRRRRSSDSFAISSSLKMSKDVHGEKLEGRQKRPFKKRKRNEKNERNGSGKKKAVPGSSAGSIVRADQLAWKGISVQNDEFDDFEEIEGVDVEHIKRDGQDVIRFKV
jgi:hypothetical protein